jgi:hypothetical protein
MRKHICINVGLVLALAVAVCGAGWWTSSSLASDHDESPLVKADASMDLTDLYVFDSGGGETTAIVCWAGFNDSRPQPDAAALYNPDALYTLNIDNDEDNVADFEVQWRYGQNGAGDWGVQVVNIPGTSGQVAGAVETVLDSGGGTRVWSGHADDPFFFDAQGYLDTLSTGTLMITNSRDFLAGLNVTAMAIEMNTAAMRDGSNELRFWATAARKP